MGTCLLTSTAPLHSYITPSATLHRNQPPDPRAGHKGSAPAPAREGTRLDLVARAGSCTETRAAIREMAVNNLQTVLRGCGPVSGGRSRCRKGLCPHFTPLPPLHAEGCSGCPREWGPPSHGSILTRAFLDRKATEPPRPELSLGYAILQCNSEIKPFIQGTLAEPQLPRLKAISASSRATDTPQRRAGGSTVTGGPRNPDINY